jgi:hypothetical protein
MMERHATIAVVSATVIALAIVVAVVIGAAMAPPRSKGPIQSCSEWTDGCRVCSRTPQGVACSTPGIACVTGNTVCLKR